MANIADGLTRREALTLMGIGGATAAAFAVTGCTPQAKGGNDAAAEAPESSVEPQEAPQAPTEYAEYDVVVVGAGGGGLAAAASLGKYGVESVLVLEAATAAGGNTLLSHGSITCNEPPDYAKADMTPEYQRYIDDIIESGPQNDSEERWWDQFIAEYEDWQKNGDTAKCFDSPLFNSLDYARKDEVDIEAELPLYDRLPEFTEWVTGDLGIKFKVCYGGSGYPWPRSTGIEGASRGEGWINKLMEQIDQNGYPVEFRYSTAAKSLIADYDGKVVGVNAEDKNGNKMAAFARRGVVLATGGFSANRALLQRYNLEFNHRWIGQCLTDGTAYQMGDHVVMAEALGADVNQMERIQFLTQCDARTGAENTLIGDRLRTLLRVDWDGKRFVGEDASRLAMTRAINDLPEGSCLQISDKNTSLVENGVNAFGVPVSTLQELGTLFVADTLEDLAKAFGADPQVFAETVKTYNRYCDAYEDPDFGNVLCAPDCKTLEPPFYAYNIAPASHITYGGLVVDDNFNVIKFDGETHIDSLYAIGDAREGTGGIDISLPDGYYMGKFLMTEVQPQDRAEVMEQVKAEEEAVAKAEAEVAAEAEAAANVSYKDGAYTGTGNGMSGAINVTLEISGGTISVTDISPNNETVGVGGYEAIEDGTYAQLIEAAQSPNFDVVSGATITSEAIKTAVSEALEGAV